MSDLVSRVLAAIEGKEQKARAARDSDGYSVHISDADVQAFWEDNDPAAVIRHCKADRATVVQYEILFARRNYMPGMGETLAVLKTVIERLAGVYGISVEEETTGE